MGYISGQCAVIKFEKHKGTKRVSHGGRGGDGENVVLNPLNEITVL
jgi:hypothetical protein